MIDKTSSDADGIVSDASASPFLPSAAMRRVLLLKISLWDPFQLQFEQKMRMKMAEKVRLRRKGLVKKLCLRKKGQETHSKLKNKNV